MKKSLATEGTFASRRRSLLRHIEGEAALFPAAPLLIRSRDQHVQYTPDANLFYLTGFSEPKAGLLLRSVASGPRSVLYVRERNLAAERWEGEFLGTKRARARFDVDEVRDIAQLELDLVDLLKGIPSLHYAPGTDGSTDELIWELFRTSVAPRSQFPHTLKDSRVLLAQMRAVKDRAEKSALAEAADITAAAFADIAPLLADTEHEAHLAALLEAHFIEYGASGRAFDTIVATGKNATVLHHRPGNQRIRPNDVVLVDAGASYEGYAGDISRTFPASGQFTSAQGEAYDVVVDALYTAIEKAKPGETLDSVHRAAVVSLTKGLRQLGILSGRVETLVAKERYKPYFMHGIGHFLGLDVHDIAPIEFLRTGKNGKTRIREARFQPLVPGNVITCEPGLYFDVRDERVPAELRGVGIRIEDDILITSSGAKILSERMPVERDEIETLMSSGPS